MSFEPLSLEKLESIPEDQRKGAVASLLSAPDSEAAKNSLAQLYLESRSKVGQLSLSSLEALSLPTPPSFPISITEKIEDFREELHAHLQATYGGHPRKLHAILYSMGFPTDVGCG